MNDYSFMIGKKYGRWTPLYEYKIGEKTQKYRAMFCQCDCGEKRSVKIQSLLKGQSKSCGCLHSEIMKNLKSTVTHGYAHKEKLYEKWKSMRRRCSNEKCDMYYIYGGRGIKVCPEWRDYAVFREWAMANGYVEGLQIDRIDNDKGYSPENCRFVTAQVNADNRRNVRHHVIGGVRYNEAQLEKKYNFKKDYLGKAARRGWKLLDIVNGKAIWDKKIV